MTFRRSTFERELAAVAARHGLRLVWDDGIAVKVDGNRDLFTVRFEPARAASAPDEAR